MDSVDNSVFSTIWPLLTDEEWNRLENESFQNGIRVPQEPVHPEETEVDESRTHVAANSLGPEHPGSELEVLTEVRGDRVEGFGLDPPAPDEPEGNVDHYSGQNPQEPDDPGETELAQFSIQIVGTNSMGPEHPDTNSIFASCLPLFTDEEWNSLKNEYPDSHPLGPDSEVENEVRDGAEGSRPNPPVPDLPGGNGDHISSQTPQEPDHPRESEVGKLIVQAVGTNSVGPKHPDTNSIFASCLSLFTDEEWNRLENEFPDSHPLGPDSEVENEVRDGAEGSTPNPPVPDQPGGNGDHISGQTPQEQDHPRESEVGKLTFPNSDVENEVRDGVEGSTLNPPVPDQPGGNGDHISGQTPQEPDHPGESEVGKLVLQAVGTNSLVPEYTGKDGEGENLPQRLEHAPPGLAPEACSNHRKKCSRPPKRPELAAVVPVPPRSDCGSPKSPEFAPAVSDAAENSQNLPRQGSSQHSRHPREKRGLPEGWTVKVKVRKRGNSAGNKDKTYIEQSTQKRCRSIPDVWRYIESRGSSSE